MIKNISKNIVICNNKKILKNVFEKALGLMFSKPINDIGYVFVFDKIQKVSLHMFFVFFPIDVVFLDENKKVVEIKENFRPFSFYTSKNKVKYVIEMPFGSVKKKIYINNVLFF
ncbi:MAG: DUF192 domain-containing protein [Candidatus Woesearchaeota archaeon]